MLFGRKEESSEEKESILRQVKAEMQAFLDIGYGFPVPI